MTLRVGLIQTRTPASHAAALAHVAPLVREAAAQGAGFIATPEGTNILQKDKAALAPVLTLLEDDPVVQGLQALARGGGRRDPAGVPEMHAKQRVQGGGEEMK